MRTVSRATLVLLFAAVPFMGSLLAQTGGPPVGGQPPCWPPPCIPIDGGLSLLIGAGMLLGGKKALDARRARLSGGQACKRAL